MLHNDINNNDLLMSYGGVDDVDINDYDEPTQNIYESMGARGAQPHLSMREKISSKLKAISIRSSDVNNGDNSNSNSNSNSNNNKSNSTSDEYGISNIGGM